MGMVYYRGDIQIKNQPKEEGIGVQRSTQHIISHVVRTVSLSQHQHVKIHMVLPTMKVHQSLRIFTGAISHAAHVANLEFPALPKVGLISVVSSVSKGRNNTA